MQAAIDDSYDLKTYLSESKCNLLQYFPFKFSLDNYREILSSCFIYIGVTEFSQASVNVLAKIIGFSPVDVGYLNVADRQETVPNGAREIFEQKHKLEYAIYEYALKNYENIQS